MILGPLMWLIGFRVLERDDEHVLIRLPVFMSSDEVKTKVTSKLSADYAVQHPGSQLRWQIGNRLLRGEKIKPMQKEAPA